MIDVFFTGPAAWFSTAAVIGAAFFALRMAMMLIGLGGGDLHVGVDASDVHHGDPTEAFKLLSVQSVAGFLMGFGCGGLGALLGTGWSLPVSMLVAVACGGAMVYLLAVSMRFMSELQSSGTVETERAVGAEGDVYLTVPKAGEGAGQVKVVIGDRQRILPAVSSDDAIPSQARIRVMRVNDDRTVTVARI